MAAAARITFRFLVSYLLFVSAASRVAVLPFASHEDEGRPTLPSEEMTSNEVSLPSIDAEGFQQVDLTLRRPFDVHRLHHHHHHHEDHDALDDHHHHHCHHFHHHHQEDEFLDERHHHRHRHNGEGFVIPYGNDMLMGENSMPGNGEVMEKEVGHVEAAERGAVEELKEWNPSSVDWEQVAEERRRHRKAKCEHKKKRSEEDSDSDDEDDDEAEDRKKELKWMRKKQMKERKDREEDGWMEWFSGIWNGF